MLNAKLKQTPKSNLKKPKMNLALVSTRTNKHQSFQVLGRGKKNISKITSILPLLNAFLKKGLQNLTH